MAYNLFWWHAYWVFSGKNRIYVHSGPENLKKSKPKKLVKWINFTEFFGGIFMEKNHEIDLLLFDFTSFFGLDFFKIFWPTVPNNSNPIPVSFLGNIMDHFVNFWIFWFKNFGAIFLTNNFCFRKVECIIRKIIALVIYIMPTWTFW